MSKKSLYLLGILLTIMLGMYFYWKYCCNGELDSTIIKDSSVENVTLEGESPLQHPESRHVSNSSNN